MPRYGVWTPISKYQFLKTHLAFKMPKSSILVTYIGILNAKKEAFKMPIFWHFKCQNWSLKCQKRFLSFMKWTPGERSLLLKMSIVTTTYFIFQICSLLKGLFINDVTQIWNFPNTPLPPLSHSCALNLIYLCHKKTNPPPPSLCDFIYEWSLNEFNYFKISRGHFLKDLFIIS